MPETTLIIIAGCVNPGWVGDGYCDDTTNNMVCNYDGGDCCGSNINTQYCSECQCLDGNNGTMTTTPVYGNREGQHTVFP